jgi:hypothetical protein
MTATQTNSQTTDRAGSETFASRLRAAVEQDHRSVPAHRRARDWHSPTQRNVANPRRTRGLRVPGDETSAGTAEDFAARLRRAVD